MAKIKAEFLLDRQGKTVATLAGLLDAGHSEGLSVIDTQLIQFGSEENNHTWIFRAQVTTSKGTFSGFGDANPANVSRNMLTVLPRMAESRAIARALRWAVNSTVAAAEEFSDEDEPTHAAPSQPAPRTVNPTPSQPAPQGPRPQPQTGIAPPRPQQAQPQGINLATPAQVGAIYQLGRDRHKMSEKDVDGRAFDLFGAVPTDLSREQASQLIDALKK